MALALALTALSTHAQLIKPDYEQIMKERDWQEIGIKLPAFPQADRLLEFYVSATTTFRFFIDPLTLAAGDDGVIRYVLVARSSSGVENVWFEGIRCKSGEFKQYATGRSDGSWVARRGAPWIAIDPKTMNRQHQALRREFFCPNNDPITSAAEGIDALRRGGHPNAKGAR
ncbi:MAG: CNP1-like family protein [Betaproteobacteria bacterium]|nr:CNP1-like family protein [Betaproteobacteria bacterium]